MTVHQASAQSWPSLPFSEWQDTCATLHMWTQIVGKIRLALEPTGQSLVASAALRHVHRADDVADPLSSRAASRSISTSAGMCSSSATSDPRRAEFALGAYSVAEFYDKIMSALRELGIDVAIWTMPVEVMDAVPFEQDHQHKSYDADAVQRFWRALVQCDRVMKHFRAGFIGKVSPGAFLLGQLRSCGDAVFREDRTRASRWHA